MTTVPPENRHGGSASGRRRGLRDGSRSWIAALAASGALLLPSAAAAQPDTRSAPQAAAENLTVMIEAGSDSWGAGIIIGQREDRLYIATANHVLASGESGPPRVALRWRNRAGGALAFLDAEIVPHARSVDDDIAILTIRLSSQERPRGDALLFRMLGDSAGLEPDDRLRPLGYPRRSGWDGCNQPDFFRRLEGMTIHTEAKCIEHGDSGGPLVDERWQIVGLVLDDSAGSAIRIERVLDLAKGWNIPVSLRPAAASDVAAFQDVAPSPLGSCAVALSGRVYCWGSVWRDEDTMVDAPVAIPRDDDPRDYRIIRNLGGTDCAVSQAGLGYCWGRLTDSSGSSRISLTAVPLSGPPIRAIEGSGPQFCLLAVDGALQCGRLTHDPASGFVIEPIEEMLPKPPNGRWQSIAAQGNIACGINSAGSLLCWGSSPYGFAPRGPSSGAFRSEIEPSLRFRSVAIGGDSDSDGPFGCAVTTANDLACWGGGLSRWRSDWPGWKPDRLYYPNKQLKFESVAAGWRQICGITTDRRLACLGKADQEKEAEAGDGVMRIVPMPEPAAYVRLSLYMACAGGVSGALYCWGENASPGTGPFEFAPDGLSAPSLPVRVGRCPRGRIGEMDQNEARVLPYNIASEQYVTHGAAHADFRRDVETNAEMQKLIPASVAASLRLMALVEEDIYGRMQACDIDMSSNLYKDFTALRAKEFVLTYVYEDRDFLTAPKPRAKVIAEATPETVERFRRLSREFEEALQAFVAAYQPGLAVLGSAENRARAGR